MTAVVSAKYIDKTFFERFGASSKRCNDDAPEAFPFNE